MPVSLSVSSSLSMAARLRIVRPGNRYR
jgi:hypothetical protein